MPEDINLTQVWDNKTFRVYRGKLKARSLVKGPSLGHGFIYYVGPGNIQHFISDASADAPVELSRTNKSYRCLWNPGSLTEVRNAGTSSVELLRVAPKYQSKVVQVLPKQTLALATAFLVSGNWSKSFKASVEVDLAAIGALALALSRDIDPTQEQLLSARAAQEDLEIKLEWLLKSFKTLKKPHESLQAFAFGGGGGLYKRLVAGKRAEPPFDTSLRVKVNTKDASGTHDVPGCEVWWIFAGYGSNYSNASRFPSFSTPTIDTMEVGRYTMWTKKQNVIGDRTPIRVGPAGGVEQTVDLSAPAL